MSGPGSACPPTLGGSTAADEDRVAALLDAAATLAADDPGAAGALAVEAALLLPAGDEDRHGTFATGAQLLARAGRHGDAADAWARVADEAGDDDARAAARSAEGEAARRAGDWPRAAEAHRAALHLAEAVHGEAVSTAVMAQNLAMTYKYTGRFDEAEALYRRALATCEAAGEEALVAVICHNLGGLAHARGDHEAGIPWARRSLRLRADLNDPIGLASDQGALAGLLIGAGQLREAAALLHAARATFAERLGEDDREVAVVDGNLAAIALQCGQLEEAERRGRSALAGEERAFGPCSPELAVTLTTLGTVRRQQGDRPEAAALHRRALAVLTPAVEPAHPLLATILENLAAAERRRWGGGGEATAPPLTASLGTGEGSASTCSHSGGERRLGPRPATASPRRARRG